MRSSKVVSACIFNELQAVGLFLAFGGVSTRTDHFTSGKKYRKLVNNTVFIRNKRLFFVSVVATSVFQLEHMPRLLRTVCPGSYRIRTIEYGKILVLLVNGEYYGRVYEVYNKYGWECNMVGYCTSVRPYFHTAQQYNIQPYCLLNQIHYIPLWFWKYQENRQLQ